MMMENNGRRPPRMTRVGPGPVNNPVFLRCDRDVMKIILRACCPRRVRAYVEPLFELPSSKTVFVLVFVLYFLLTSGIVYDLVNQPRSTGTTRDRLTGAEKPQAILPNRLNAQFIIEGMAAGLLFVLGGLSFIFLDNAHNTSSSKAVRYLLLFGGFSLLAVSYNGILLFMKIKLPGYLEYK